jgi:hypothetical protein
MANGGKENVNMYAAVIERYLKNEDVSHSESEIAREVLNVTLDTNDDLPSSTNDLDKLTEIRESLRVLLSQGKIFQTLVQDPFTKEETAYYGFRKDSK